MWAVHMLLNWRWFHPVKSDEKFSYTVQHAGDSVQLFLKSTALIGWIKFTASPACCWALESLTTVGVLCQAIEPVVGEDLCRLFPADSQVDLHTIALKSRDAMAKRGLNPHEEYKRAELKRLAVSKLCVLLGYYKLLCKPSQVVSIIFVMDSSESSCYKTKIKPRMWQFTK